MRPVSDTDALIVVDVQNCFCPGGSLGVEEGDRVVPIINALVPLFAHVAFTRDWHPPEHTSFGDPPEFRDGSWPEHCVRDTPGAEFHPDLIVHHGALIVSKATQPEREEYSGFESSVVDIAAWLRGRSAKHVYIVGLATDYCVRATALDALAKGFAATVVEDAVRGVAPDTTAAAMREMLDAGVELVGSAEIIGGAKSVGTAATAAPAAGTEAGGNLTGGGSGTVEP